MKYYICDGELYHYGVKGMKWGVHKDEKYSRRRYGSASKKADSKVKNDRDHSKSNKSELAVFAVNAFLDVVMMNPVGLVIDSTRAVQAGESYVKSKIYDNDRKGCTVDKKTGFRLKKRDFSSIQDAARVNPLVHNFDSNTKNNCMLCTSTYDLRRRGYEVRAKKASYGYLPSDVKAWYPKAKINKITGSSVKDMIDKVKNELVKQGNGSRGNLMIKWNASRGGHSVAYEVTDGTLKIIDAQVNKIYNNPDRFLNRCAAIVEYARLDNIAFNPKTIKEVSE